MRKKGLLDLMDVVIDRPFIKKVIEYHNSNKLKLPPINLYDGIKDLINSIQAFQSHMVYISTTDAIM